TRRSIRPNLTSRSKPLVAENHWRSVAMAGRLENKIAVVIGASRGIGRAAALALAKEGADVVVTARTQGELDTLVKEIEALGRRGLAVAADVTQEADVERLKAEALKTFGRVDILVN